MAELRLRGLRKTFANGARVVDGIDLDVADGEFVALVGPSGCGKSTLLRLIAGLEDADHGEILVGGQAVHDVRPAERGVAMVFQSYALYPHMTVAQNMGFALEMAGATRAEIARKVGRAAEILQLGPLLQRKPAALSGGQRQRVAIGRAIVRTPRVFLFDEPLSNLDASLRVQMRMELARLHRELGATMIYVTHDQVEAMTLGQRIAVLNQGRLEQVGSPLALFDTPANRFVAGFLGSPRMNFIDARPAGSFGGYSVVHCGGTARWRVLGTIDRPCCLGVRPEDLRLAEPGSGLHTVVQAVEHLGDTVIAYAQASGLDGLLTVRLPPDRRELQAGQDLWLLPAAERIHVFDVHGLAWPRDNAPAAAAATHAARPATTPAATPAP